MSQREQAIVEFISGLVAGTEAGDVRRDTQLLEAGVLDSINLVRLVQFLEETFSIRIPDEDLGPDLFDTPATIAAYVDRRTA